MKLGKGQLVLILGGLGLPIAYYYGRDKLYALQRTQAKTAILKDK
jgi:hypothetical protein